MKLYEPPINEVIMTKAEETKYTAFLKNVYTKILNLKSFWLLLLACQRTELSQVIQKKFVIYQTLERLNV